jgi:hypothetical protein
MARPGPIRGATSSLTQKVVPAHPLKIECTRARSASSRVARSPDRVRPPRRWKPVFRLGGRGDRTGDGRRLPRDRTPRHGAAAAPEGPSAASRGQSHPGEAGHPPGTPGVSTRDPEGPARTSLSRTWLRQSRTRETRERMRAPGARALLRRSAAVISVGTGPNDEPPLAVASDRLALALLRHDWPSMHVHFGPGSSCRISSTTSSRKRCTAASAMR